MPRILPYLSFIITGNLLKVRSLKNKQGITYSKTKAYKLVYWSGLLRNWIFVVLCLPIIFINNMEHVIVACMITEAEKYYDLSLHRHPEKSLVWFSLTPRPKKQRSQWWSLQFRGRGKDEVPWLKLGRLETEMGFISPCFPPILNGLDDTQLH